MNKFTLSIYLILSLFALPLSAQEYSAEGDYSEHAGCSSESKLETIYIFNSLADAKLTYGTKSTSSVKFYSFKHSISDSTYIPITSTNTVGSYTFHTIDNLQNNTAYFVKEDGNDKAAVWIITNTSIIAKQELQDGSLVEEIDGSAPAMIHFDTDIEDTDNLYYTWRIFNESDTENPMVKYTDPSINYTFDRAGKYIVKLEIANMAFDCAFIIDSFPLEIYESSIDLIPNFISPGGSPGINDEFKIKYKSLVKFKCTIFNRWGVKLYQWTDPEKGWNGTYKGAKVKPGVYFYVIEATGSEGRKYRKMGDINILK